MKKIMKSFKYFHGILRSFLPFLSTIIVILGIMTLSSFTSTSNSNNTFGGTSDQDYRIISPPIPLNPEFCGEEVPIKNFEVYERFEREMIVSTYYHSSTLLYLKRTNRWFPIIEPILADSSVPDDFKYLALTESGLDNVISPKGATGFWQFLEDTGRKYGLEINNEVDERYNVEKSTRAACSYLLQAYRRFGTWTMAAASYNFGIEGIEKQIGRQQSNNYYNLVFAEETSRYILRIVALKEVLSDPQKYGFFMTENELYNPYETYSIEIRSQIDDLALFAKSYDINYKILKYFNPWLRENYLSNPGGKSYILKIPATGSIYVIPDFNFESKD